MKYLISKKFNLFSAVAFFLLSFIAVMFFAVSSAQAVTPTLSLTATGNGDFVQLNVTGDPNANVLFVYIKTGLGQQITPIGTTDTNGTFSTAISSLAYGIPSGNAVHVILGSLNGPQSSDATWPAVASLLSGSNMLSLSQTGVMLSVGQTSTVTVNNLNGSSLYLASNSNPQIANFNITGSQVSILANSFGNTTGRVCLVNNTSNCGSLTVTVTVTGSSSYIAPPVTTNTTVPVDCTGALYSVSTGQACPASTVITNPIIPTDSYTSNTQTPSATTIFEFTKSIKLGSTGTEVSQLQTKLKTLGFYKGKIDGGFGATTEKAVKAFQKAHKLPQVGNVGPKTRALLNN